MTLFLIIFFSVYGFVHTYLGYHLLRVARPGWPGRVLVVLVLLTLVCSPVLMRISERSGLVSLGRFFGWTGFVWMGYLFLLFNLLILLDAGRIIAKVGEVTGKASFASALRLLSSPQLAATLALFAGVVFVYGWFEARDIQVTRLTVTSPKIPPAADGLKIAQISDVHLGSMLGVDRLDGILDRVDEEEVDLLLATGDIFDSSIEPEDEVFERLRSSIPRLGAYGCLGNHEAYIGVSNSLYFSEKAGIKILRSQSAEPMEGLHVGGVDDPALAELWVSPHKGTPGPSEEFSILLKHRPLEELGKWASDLQLSGHTHGGQIFPFGLLSRKLFPLEDGVNELAAGAILYKSRGAGTWGPPIRVLAPPEVTILTLRRTLSD